MASATRGAGPHRDPSPPASVLVEVEIARAGRSATSRHWVAPGTRVREIVRAAGEAPEGSAVLRDGVSVPLDLPVTEAIRLVIVPTFSGG